MIRMETIGEVASHGMKHSTFTLEENIAFMEQAVSMARIRKKHVKNGISKKRILSIGCLAGCWEH